VKGSIKMLYGRKKPLYAHYTQLYGKAWKNTKRMGSNDFPILSHGFALVSYGFLWFRIRVPMLSPCFAIDFLCSRMVLQQLLHTFSWFCFVLLSAFLYSCLCVPFTFSWFCAGRPILSRCFALVFLCFLLLLFSMFFHCFAVILMCFLMRRRVPLPLFFLTFSWYGHGFPEFSHASSLVWLCFSIVFVMGFHYVFLRICYGSPMLSDVFLQESLMFSNNSVKFPYTCSWLCYGFPMHSHGFAHGSVMVFFAFPLYSHGLAPISLI
jgi:hypothetical protein